MIPRATAGFLQRLRQPQLRGRFTALLACAVFVAGIAHAAHFHKIEPGHAHDLHLSCLLCLHADRAAPPPQLPAPPRVVPARCIRTISRAALCPAGSIVRRYFARAPPLA